MRNGCLVGALVASILVTFAAQAHAQAGWADTPALLTERGSGETKIGMDTLGNAVAVWTDHRSGVPFGDLFAGQYAVATRQWRSSIVRPYKTVAWDLAVDGVGNAFAVAFNVTLAANFFEVHRYDRATGRWEAIPSSGLKTGALVAMNVAGSATVCWNHPNTSVYCSRYTPSTGTWSAEIEVGSSTTLGGVAMDAAGVAHVVWVVGSNVRTARFDPNTGAWGAPHDLAVGLAAGATPNPQLAVSGAGRAVATWTRGSVLEASRYVPGIGWAPAAVLSVDGSANASARAAVDPAGVITVAWAHETASARTMQVARSVGGVWTTPVDVSRPEASALGPPAVAADAAGNVHVVWRQLVGGRAYLVATRYASGTDQWAEPSDLSGPADTIFEPHVAVDGAGNAMGIWAQDGTVRSRRWDATPAPPTITAVSPVAGALSVSFVLPPPGTDPALGVSGYEYSLDGGATWGPTPLPMVSPLTIAGLTDGVTYNVRLRASNSAGAGRATDPLFVTSGTDIALRDLRVVARTGHTLTFAWKAPAGVLPSTYVLQGGVVPGQTLATLPVAGAHTNVTVTMPTGVFYIRVAALLPLGASPTSNEIRVAVDTAEAPAAPANVLGTVNGSNLELSWTNVVNGGIPTSLTVHVSGTVTGSMALPVGETLAVSGVPPGTYTLALTASNAAGTSAPSAPVTLTFPAACAGPPTVPRSLSAAVSGGLVTVAWDPPATGSAVTVYLFQVSGAIQGTLPVTVRMLTASPPSGSYLVSVAAANACGTGVATVPVTVVVP